MRLSSASLVSAALVGSHLALAQSVAPTDVVAAATPTFTSTDPVVYTGAAATVAASLTTADLAQTVVAAAAASPTPGVLHEGELTWYSAGQGGYGSCGLQLYDGEMSVPFVALSLFEWMGTPGPSSHCFECVEIFNAANPATTITAIVADSCQVCTFGHIAGEQAIYTQLGGDLGAGAMDIGWSFVECPAGYTSEALAAVSPAEYVPISF